MNLLPWILALICAVVIAWAMEERRRRGLADSRYEMTKAQRDQAAERFDNYLTKKMARDDAFEVTTMRQRGVPVPDAKKEEPKPREHRAVGASQRLAKYLGNQPAPSEPIRTIGPTDKVS